MATEIAASRYNEKNKTDLKPVKLFRANYSFWITLCCYITFELSDGKFYEALVILKHRENSIVKMMREALHYPALTEAYTYHEFDSSSSS